MTDLTPRRVDELSARAEQFYNPKLALHNWNHPLEVRRDFDQIIDNYLGGRRKFGPAMSLNRAPVYLAIAHHDDEHDSPENANYPSKEAYAAFIARRELAGEVEPEIVDEVEGIILATRLQAPRVTLGQVAAHYADVWSMADKDHEVFLDVNTRLWIEAGRPPWEGYKRRARKVIAITIEESLREFCPRVAAWGGDPYHFPIYAKKNMEQFANDPEPGL